MTVGNFNRRTLYTLLGGLAFIAILKWGVYGDRTATVSAAVETVPAAEKRLEILRQKAATVPGREALMKQVSAELATREKGVIQADTAAQAQVQLLDIIHRAAGSGFDARGAEELREARALGADYGEVSVTVAFTCQIEQLVNFLAEIANQPQVLATNSIHINSLNDKRKSIQVRLNLSGVVPRKLVPVKKAGAF